MSLQLVPIKRDEAREWVKEHHRHNRPPPGEVLRVAVADETGAIRGVGLAGRPVARALDDGFTLEVTRLCTDGCNNGCSKLYGALNRARKALGWRRMITYTRADEPGTSLRAAGWCLDKEIAPRDGWDCETRPRGSKYDSVGRLRWVAP